MLSHMLRTAGSKTIEPAFTLVAINEYTTTSGVTTPSSTQVGDIILFNNAAANSGTSSAPLQKYPTGYTLISSQTAIYGGFGFPAQYSYMRGVVSYKIATTNGSESISSSDIMSGSESLPEGCRVQVIIFRPIGFTISSVSIKELNVGYPTVGTTRTIDTTSTSSGKVLAFIYNTGITNFPINPAMTSIGSSHTSYFSSGMTGGTIWSSEVYYQYFTSVVTSFYLEVT